MNTLYISYDGILEPLGRSQVVNYLIGLSPAYRQTILSFEKPQDLQQCEKVRELDHTLRAAGICWIRRRYHKWPPVGSTLVDVLVGILAGLLPCLTGRIRVVHARGYVPALIGLFLKRVAGPKLLFDMRGFWADEKVDGGHWSCDSMVYAVTKRCERSFYESSDAIVSLTEEGAKAIQELGYRVSPSTPIRVIPTCTDLEKFSPGPKNQALLERLGLAGHRVVGCVGTMSNWYLRQPMLQYLGFLTQRLGDVKVLIVTREDHVQIKEEAIKVGIQPDRLVLTRVEFPEMPTYIRLMDLGMFFIKVCFSKRGSAATKLGEFLACGVPVIINDGVGDSGWIVRRHRVGVVLSDTTARDFESSLHPILEILKDRGTSERCRDTARRYFDLSEGIRAYATLYRELGCTAVKRRRRV